MSLKELFSKDKSFEGELVNLERHIKKSDDDLENNKIYSYHKFVIKKGNKEYSFIYKGHKEMNFTRYFHIGEQVKHISGYDIPVRCNRSGESEILCIICGEFTNAKKNHCQYCGEVILR